MAQLKASEKRLLFIFVGIGFLMANYFGYTWVTEHQSALEIERGRLEQEKGSFQQLAGEREKWAAVRDWVDGRMPVYRTEDDRDTYLISLVRNRAQQAAVEIVAGPNSRDPELGTFYEQTLVNVAVQGEIGPIVRWLHSLQAPGEFRAVTSLIMKPAKKESSELRCEITLEQWWSLDSQAIAMAGGAGGAGSAAPAGNPSPSMGGSDASGDGAEPGPGAAPGVGTEAVAGTAAEAPGAGESAAGEATGAPGAGAEPEQVDENVVQEGNQPEDS